MGAIDYWCNAFTPEFEERWDAAISDQDIPLRIHRQGDGFASPEDFVARMDALDIETVILPCADVPEDAKPHDYERFTTEPGVLPRLSTEHPGRIAGLFSIAPDQGWRGVERASQILREPGFVGLHLHTHSFDRRFDDRDLYPYYALAAELEVPVVVQAGSSGGLMPSECGHPIGIDRPALYFDSVSFVLSHTGWPWTEVAIAMAQKHPNVFLGTAAWPPHHWSPELVRFLGGVGRGKTLFGTSFPTVGHRHALERLTALDIEEEARSALLSETARRVFTRLSKGA